MALDALTMRLALGPDGCGSLALHRPAPWSPAVTTLAATLEPVAPEQPSQPPHRQQYHHPGSLTQHRELEAEGESYSAAVTDLAVPSTGQELLHNYLHQRYTLFLQRVKDSRAHHPKGLCPLSQDMFAFFEARLVHKFNKAMFKEFKSMAMADAAAGNPSGMEHLFRFFRGSLQRQLRKPLLRDFIDLAAFSGGRAGVEQLWFYLRDCSPEARHISNLRIQGSSGPYSDLQASLRSLDSLYAFF